ncbi:NADP-dependent oxidoreductase [Nocardia sp. NPDC052566]|uniref:NADP-dependent oxidoreductase n=1 Tax=Nocardia sp. NPDC052566 TaxID=3364330 RepID=UPI0037CC74D6
MRAVAFGDFGQSPLLTELPVPEPGPGEVLVRIGHSSINGFDLGVLGGYLKGVYEYEFPVVPGKDFAGTVAAVGAEVSTAVVGDAVFGVIMRSALGQGGWAEYVAVPAEYGIAAIPAGLDPAAAGALGLAGTAALNSIDAVELDAGATVLISGATGGVGAYAIQLAVARGAIVIATARPGAEADFVTGLGAALVVDHSGDLTEQVMALRPDGVDAVVHLAGEGRVLAELIRAGGRFASTVHFTPEHAAARDIKAVTIMSDPNRATLDRLAADAASGALRVPIAGRYPLAEAPQAIAAFTGGTLGKLAITIE